MNANLEEYKVPTVAGHPEIEYVHVNLPDPEANPTGAKGIGEPPLIPTAPAIANAVFDAVGVRIRETPLGRRRASSMLATRWPARPAAGRRRMRAFEYASAADARRRALEQVLEPARGNGNGADPAALPGRRHRSADADEGRHRRAATS